MNMISTAFPIETDASTRQDKLVAKLVGAWEKKNSKAARAGGVSLMALSLAACGAEDDTPFAQTDIDAATAPLSAAVIVAEAATVAAQTQAATAVVAQAQAETAAATAVVAQLAAETAAATALVGKLASDQAAAAATVGKSQAEAALVVAEAAKATAEAAKATAEANLVTAQASLATETASKVAAEASLATVQASYDALIAPQSLAATSLATDNLLGGVGDDTFTAPAGTVQAGDRFADTSITDNDTLNVTHSTTLGTFTASNIENINLTLNSLGGIPVDLVNVTGVTALTVTRGDVIVGGSTLAGNKAVSLTNYDSANIGSLTVGAGTTTVNVDSAALDVTGHVLNLDAASGAITVDGAATINAATSSDVRIDATTSAAISNTGKASLINAAVAGRVDTAAGLTGSIEINAPQAALINVADAQGGATITAATTNTGDSTITVVDGDVSGTTIITGTGSATASAKQINVTIDGGAATTDTASVSGAGVIALDIDGANDGNMDLLTLSGNGAAVTYNVDYTNTPAFISATKGGTESVTIAGDVALLTGAAVTVTNIDVVDINAEVGGDQAIDTSLFSGVGKIDLGIDNGTGNAVTVVTGQTVEVTADQAGALNFNFSAAGGGDFTLVAGDDNGANVAVGTIAITGELNQAAAATVVGTVTLEASISNLSAGSTVMGALQDIVITGDENVTLGAVTANSVSAINSTGIINMTAANNVDVVSLGSGNDTLVINDATGNNTGNGHTVIMGAGTDTLTITDTASASSFDTGAGGDTINYDDATSNIVVVGGAGNDTFATSVAISGTIIGGEGSDTLTIDGAGALVLGATFAMQSIEKVNIAAANGVVQISDAQLAGSPVVEIQGDAAADIFQVQTASTAALAKTIDATGVTLSTTGTATIQYAGAVGVDTITGGVASETILYSPGNDTISAGGTGTDTLSVTNGTVTGSTITITGSAATTGLVVNLSSAAIGGATVALATGDVIAGSTVAAGTGAYLFNLAAATNNTSVTAIEGIENFTSIDATGIEYVVGSTDNNVISTFGGADHIFGGEGADTITSGTGIDTINVGLNDNAQDIIIVEDTVSNNGLDVVTAFGSEDLITLSKADYALNGTASADALNSAIAAGTYYEGAVGASIASTTYDVIVSTASFADVGASEDAVAARSTATTDGFVIFHDTGTTQAHMYFDSNISTDANLTASATLMTFEGVASAAALAALFSNANFELIA